MKNRISALLLTLALALSLAAPALAHEAADFADVPKSHWAYKTIMEMADKGVMKGVGGNRFDPAGTVTAEMFITLVGRVVFPEVQPQGDDWAGPYVAAFRENSWEPGFTKETIKEGITRYDMARILDEAVDLIGMRSWPSVEGDGTVRADIDPRALRDIYQWGDAGNLADYDQVPDRYQIGVLTAYTVGLMTGDQSGRFNGENTTTRMEAATVMSRLLTLKEEVAQARKLRTELVTQELATLLPEDPTQEEVADAVYQVSYEWCQNLFIGGWTGSFTEEERETIRTGLGISEEIFNNGRIAGASRREDVVRAEERTKDFDAQTTTTLTTEELAFKVRDYPNDLEPRDLKALMDKRGLAYEDFEAAYQRADTEAWSASYWLKRDSILGDAADIAVTAAKLAKAEGRDSFTFHTYGFISRKAGMPTDFSKLHLGIFDTSGNLVCEPELQESGPWKVDLTLSTDHLDEIFTLKLLEPYEAKGYYLTTEMLPEPIIFKDDPAIPDTGGMEDLIANGFTFHLSHAQRR